MNLLKRIQKRKEDNIKEQKKREHITSVANKAGLSYAEAQRNMEYAREKYGISYKFYDRYDFFKYTSEQQVEMYKDIKFRSNRLKNDCINHTVDKTGWTKAQAVQHIKQVVKQYDIRYWEYNLYNFCHLKEAELAERKTYIDEQRELRKTVKAADIQHKEEYAEDVVAIIADRSGLPYEDVADDVKTAELQYGESPKAYLIDRFWELNDQQRQELLTTQHCIDLSHKYNADKDFSQITYRKDLTDTYFEDFLGRPWMSNAFMKLEDFKNTFKDEQKIIYKPVTGYGGNGIEVFKLNDDNVEEVFNTIKNLPEGVIEGFITEHPVLQELSNGAVSTIRVVTIRTTDPTNGIEVGKVHFLYAAFRMAAGEFCTSDEIQVGMDMHTGELLTNGADKDGNVFVTHPTTGKKIKGAVIPMMQEALDIIEREILARDVVGHYGWDIAISDKGPVLIEINSGPGKHVLQSPYNEERKGMKYIVEPYL